MKTTFGKIAEYRRIINLKTKIEKTKIDLLLDELNEDNFPIIINDKYEISKIKS